MTAQGFRLRMLACGLAAVCGVLSGPAALAGGPAITGAEPAGAPASAASERGIAEWLRRMHEGSQRKAFMGTFVVSSAESMSSAKIWHVCDGEQQMERVESLTGAPRTTLRRNDEVVTFWPADKTAVAEKREAMGLFPNMLKATDSAIAQFYEAKLLGVDRVAGAEADVVLLAARDNQRFSYRVWAERRSGLVVKLQTLDIDGKVLEQAAYSELQLDAPVSMTKLAKMMANTEGYRVHRPELVKTTALAEGWAMKSLVPGFKPMSCFRRAVGKPEATGLDGAMQWIFSDGLASVSVFVEAFDRSRHLREGLSASGATLSVTRRLSERAGDRAQDWWLTAVGEVPAPTLTQFVQGLERRR